VVTDLNHFQNIRNELTDRQRQERKLRYYETKYGDYVEKRGLKNWKNLFRKPNLLEWTILFMLIMGLFLAWAYKQDVGSCQAFIKEVNENPCKFCIINTTAPSNAIALPLFSNNLIPMLKEVNLSI
jgi:hypothetical protein